MDNTSSSREEALKTFRAITRQLFTLLALILGRNPFESLQITALCIWLDKKGFKGIVHKMVSFPNFLIDDLAKEAVICLNCICDQEFAFALDESELSMMRGLLDKRISPLFFWLNRKNAISEVNAVLKDVHGMALSDLMCKAIEKRKFVNLVDASIIPFTRSNPAGAPVGIRRIQERGRVQPDDRTLFLTFSRGYPVEAWELEEFFRRVFGDCVEYIQMQQITEKSPHPLYAKAVLRSPLLVQMILNGSRTAKFKINGKHVWMRKFVPYPPKSSPQVMLAAQFSKMCLSEGHL